MDIKEIFLIISIIFGLISPLIAIRSILIGEYKPQRITRVIFLIVLSLSVTSLYLSGDRIGLVLAIVQWINCLVIFLLSIKYGIGGRNKSDFFVFISALITLIIWKTTGDSVIALYMSIATDLIGISPTLIKSYRQPYTEDPKFYASDVVAAFFNILALKSYLIADLAFPGYIFLINAFCMIIIILRRKIIKS